MSDITKHYGGSILAVRSKDSVAILSDTRFGQGSITINTSFPKIHKITDRLFVGLCDFVPDCQNFLRKIKKNHNLFVLSEDRPMEPSEFAQMISFMLYQRRFSPLFVSPIVAGLTKDNETYICGMDLLGCIERPRDFVCAGTASTNLSGMCEVLWDENLESEDLFVTAVQAFVNAVDRDALSGWGVQGFLLTPQKIVKRSVNMRLD